MVILQVLWIRKLLGILMVEPGQMEHLSENLSIYQIMEQIIIMEVGWNIYYNIKKN